MEFTVIDNNEVLSKMDLLIKKVDILHESLKTSKKQNTLYDNFSIKGQKNASKIIKCDVRYISNALKNNILVKGIDYIGEKRNMYFNTDSLILHKAQIINSKF